MTLRTEPVVEREVLDERLGRSVDQTALCAVGLRLELDHLYRPDGPLRTEVRELLRYPPEDRTLHVGHLKRARSFAWARLQSACFPPSVIIEQGWTWHLFYALRRPRLSDGSTTASLRAMASRLATLTFAATPLGQRHPIELSGLLCPGGGRSASRLLLANPTRCYHPEDVVERVDRLLRELERLHPPVRPGASAGVPPAMVVSTLPPDWGLKDLELSPRHRQRLTVLADEDGCMDAESLGATVRMLAWRGHGWPDVEALLADPRYHLAGPLSAVQSSRLGVKRQFRAALAERDPCYRTRLPYGVRVIERLGATQPGEAQRFLLRGRNDGRPFKLEVSWNVLRSSVKFRRALGELFGSALPPMSPRVWEAVLMQATRDPRVWRKASRRPGQGEKPLTERIVAFLRTAMAYEHDSRELHPASADGWPVVREGVVIFPRQVLERRLAAELGGACVGRKELTLALESLGGGPRGVMYFGSSGRVRVWFCPLPRP